MPTSNITIEMGISTQSRMAKCRFGVQQRLLVRTIVDSTRSGKMCVPGSRIICLHAIVQVPIPSSISINYRESRRQKRSYESFILLMWNSLFRRTSLSLVQWKPAHTHCRKFTEAVFFRISFEVRDNPFR